jgi:hypothetical protein
VTGVSDIVKISTAGLAELRNGESEGFDEVFILLSVSTYVLILITRVNS